MKIFLTEVNKDSEVYIGPYIKADTIREAKVIAEIHELDLLGEVHELKYKFMANDSRVIH